MRVVVMAALVGVALATPASACPQGTRCIAMSSNPSELTSVRTFETAARPVVRTVNLTMRHAVDTTADRYAPLRSSLSTFHRVVLPADAVDMPWIWAVVASEVHSRLPRYEQADRFSMVLSPVVVTMPTESTPGVGLSGDF